VLLSYWLAIYSTILLEEHFIFRGTKFSRYNVEEVGNWRKLPLGLAAFFALGLGIMGAVFGMVSLSQMSR
jgi:purine-cytosine permease-like protein